jgi:uncharacterized membrane protein YiaA
MMTEQYDNRFSMLGCVALFILECAYAALWYQPHPSRTDAAVMIILAAECSYMLKIARANLSQKRAVGKVSRTARLYTAIAGIGILVVMGLSASVLGLDAYKPIWFAAFVMTAFGKMMWERQHKTTEITVAAQ